MCKTRNKKENEKQVRYQEVHTVILKVWTWMQGGGAGMDSWCELTWKITLGGSVDKSDAGLICYYLINTHGKHTTLIFMKCFPLNPKQ